MLQPDTKFGQAGAGDGVCFLAGTEAGVCHFSRTAGGIEWPEPELE